MTKTATHHSEEAEKNATEETVDAQTVSQKYWETWLSLLKQSIQHAMSQQQGVKPEKMVDKTHFSGSRWAEALELWWQALLPQIAPGQQDVFRKFIEQGKSYFTLNSECLLAFQQLQHLDPKSSEWQNTWEKGFATLQERFLHLRQESNDSIGFWDLPLDNWQRTLSSLSVLPSDFLEQIKADILTYERGSDVANPVESLLSVPSVGYTREWQEQLQEGIRLWLVYQKHQQNYNAQFSKIGTRTLELLYQNFKQLAEQQKIVEDLRGLYDLWVDCGEVAYAELTYTEEFAEVHGQLINSLMAWKQHERKLVDGLLGALNMPTRRDLETVTQRLHQLRRENKQLIAEQTFFNPQVLIQEVADLKSEVNLLKAQADRKIALDNAIANRNAPKSAPKVAPRKTAAKTKKPNSATGE